MKSTLKYLEQARQCASCRMNLPSRCVIS